MHFRVAAALFLLLALFLPLLVVPSADAIPAFTRQHKTECSTCHTIYPELNEYGQAFLLNAYVYSAGHGAKVTAAAPARRGDNIQAPPGGGVVEGIVLSGIPELLPLSVTATQSITYNDQSLNGDDWDFGTRSLVLQAGGTFRELVGFYATYNLFTHDSFPGGNDNRLDELFIIGRHVFQTPVNIKFGRFEPRLSLWKKSDKVLVNSFATSSYRVGGLDAFSMETPGEAIEANAVVANRVFLAGGVVDIDGQNTKDVYAHASIKIGGADFLANEPMIDFDSESVWDYLTLTLAAYGYIGRNAETTGSSVRNNFYRAGGDADIQYKRFRLRLSGLTGRDSNPEFLTPKEEVDSLALASEVEYQLGSPVNAMGIFRYEYVDDGFGITRRYIPGIAYIPLQNVRLLLQYNHEEALLSTNKSALMTVAFSF